MKHDRLSRCHFVLWITIQTLPLTEALLKFHALSRPWRKYFSALFDQDRLKRNSKGADHKKLTFFYGESILFFLSLSCRWVCDKCSLKPVFFFLCCSLKCQRQPPWQHHCLSSVVGKCLVLNLFSVGGNHSVCKFVFINWGLLYPGCPL